MDEKISKLNGSSQAGYCVYNVVPDYKRIFTDIINRKFPNKIDSCKTILNKKKLSAIDVITLNQKLFGVTCKESSRLNQKHRSYEEEDILEILDYQKKNLLNNSQLANHFKLSRNTIATWRKLFSS